MVTPSIEHGEPPLTSRQQELMHAYWRACNYLSVGMIYLKDNPLLREPLQSEHVKHRLLGHWGASPALSFVWVHLNRLIVRDDLDVIFVAGPGHGAPGVLGPAYLEGTYSEIYPDKSQDLAGLGKFFKQFSFPGHIGSHVTPETPGSIHEGGELGYSLSHAYGMAFDNPDLIVACVVGDGEAETGPLATAWHSNKFLNPIRDGAVLPILNLNGYKIANPTLLARISHAELEALFIGYGFTPYFVEGSDPADMHQKMAATLDRATGDIRAAQRAARDTGNASRPRWPMIVLRSPKGWTGPAEINGHKVEGSWRSHQVPFADVRDNPTGGARSGRPGHGDAVGAHLGRLAGGLPPDRTPRLLPHLRGLRPRFHGYPWLIHKLTYRFKGHDHLHVRGYKEKGNINTPLELAMLNETSRFHLVIDVIERVPSLQTRAAHLKEEMKNAVLDNMRYAHEHGTDRPEIANWTWPF